MQALSIETYYPANQYETDETGNPAKDESGKQKLKDNAKGYAIRPINSLQFSEVMTDGFEVKDGVQKMKHHGVKLLLRYGLKDPTQINDMSAIHIVEVAQAIFAKSSISEAERKN